MLASDGSEIRSIEAHIYRCAVDTPFGYAKGFITARESAVARLVTMDGTVGWGEAYGPAAPTADAIATIGRRVIGRTVFDREAIVRESRGPSRAEPRSVPVAAASSAIALAALDAAGRLLSQPAWTLLGGVSNPPLRVYASALWFHQTPDPTAHYDNALAAVRDQGFAAVKAKIGHGVENDLETIRRLTMAGDGLSIMVDANQAYDTHAASIIARDAADSGFVWLEEPLSPDMIADYAALRATSTIAIAGGETVTSVDQVGQWLDGEACDIFQPDPCLVGGLESAADIAAMTDGRGVVLAPHCFGLGIGLAACLHWAAAIAAVRGDTEPIWIEVDTSPNRVRDTLLAEGDLVPCRRSHGPHAGGAGSWHE